MKGLCAHGIVQLLSLLALPVAGAEHGQELPKARRLDFESTFVADDSNPDVDSSSYKSFRDPARDMSDEASRIVSGIMETFLHENELDPGELECLVNGSSEFARQITEVGGHTVALLQTVLRSSTHSTSQGNTDSSLLAQPPRTHDEAGGIEDMVDRISDGEDVSMQGSSIGENEQATKESKVAEEELGFFYGGGRRLEGMNGAAMAMSATFVGMQLAGTMQQMVHFAHEVVKKCVHADALAAFQLAGMHMRSLQYMEGHFRANGKEIAVELAAAVKAYENRNSHEFGRQIGMALRKVLLSKGSGTSLPEGPPNTTVLANMSAGLIEGFFGPGTTLDVQSDLDPLTPVRIDLHSCMQENIKFFQQVWAETLWLFAQEDMDGNAVANSSVSAKRAQFGTAIAFSMMELPGALRQCNLGEDEQQMLMDSIKAMGQGTNFKFTWPDMTVDKDEFANKMADSVEAWSVSDYHQIGYTLGRLLQEFAVKAYPQKYALNGLQLKSLLGRGPRAYPSGAWFAWVAPGLAASLVAGLLATRLVRSRGAEFAWGDLESNGHGSDSGVE